MRTPCVGHKRARSLMPSKPESPKLRAIPSPAVSPEGCPQAVRDAQGLSGLCHRTDQEALRPNCAHCRVKQHGRPARCHLPSGTTSGGSFRLCPHGPASGLTAESSPHVHLSGVQADVRRKLPEAEGLVQHKLLGAGGFVKQRGPISSPITHAQMWTASCVT